MCLQYFAICKALLESELEQTKSISFTDDFLRELFYFSALLLPPHLPYSALSPRRLTSAGSINLAHWSLRGSGQSEAPAREWGQGRLVVFLPNAHPASVP